MGTRGPPELGVYRGRMRRGVRQLPACPPREKGLSVCKEVMFLQDKCPLKDSEVGPVVTPCEVIM